MRSGVLITGADGGIGSAMVQYFHGRGWYVVGLTRDGSSVEGLDHVIQCNLIDYVNSPVERKRIIHEMGEVFGHGVELKGLINNAAVQHLSPLQDINIEDWENSFRINVTAPMLLAQAFGDELEKSSGTILNIGSVHSQATKPGFIAYATSKAALSGLTRAMAVDVNGTYRVICLAPAATATPMLVDGFKECPGKLDELAEAHPSQRIATPQEVAAVAFDLLKPSSAFLNGTTVFIDGGILSRLHDPV